MKTCVECNKELSNKESKKGCSCGANTYVEGYIVIDEAGELLCGICKELSRFKPGSYNSNKYRHTIYMKCDKCGNELKLVTLTGEEEFEEPERMKYW